MYKGRWLIFAGLSLIPVGLGGNKCDKYCISTCPEFDGNGYNRSEFFDCVDAQVDCNCLLQEGHRPKNHDQEAAKNTKHAKRNFGRDNQPVITFILFVGAIFLIWICRGDCCRSSSGERKTAPPSDVAKPVISTIRGGGGGAHVVDTSRLSDGQSEPSRTSPRRPSSVNIPIPMEEFQFPDAVHSLGVLCPAAHT